MRFKDLRFDLAVDWLELFGGAEKVVYTISELINFNTVYTLTDQRKSIDKNKFFVNEPLVKTTFLKYFKNKFKFLLPIFPYLFEKIIVDKETNVIISSSFNVAKGINKSDSKQIHISYIQNDNFRYINSKENLKLFFGNKRIFIKPFIKYLLNWDLKSAKKPDYIISNSKYTQQLIQNKYDRDSFVIYPPVDTSKFEFSDKKENYYVAIGRLVQTKRFDVLIDAFNQMPNEKLIIIGDGILKDSLKKQANSNVIFTGYLETNEVNKYLRKAKASISLGIESFGIAAVESQACGTPVIALNKGGTAETVIDGITGIHINNANIESIKSSIKKINNTEFNYSNIRKNAKQYDTSIFKQNFSIFLDKIL